MAALLRASRTLHFHNARRTNRLHPFTPPTTPKIHRRLLHIHLARSHSPLPFPLSPHIRKLWKTYGLLISVSAMGVSLSTHLRRHSASAVPDGPVNKQEHDFQKEMRRQEEEKRRDAEAMVHLLQTIQTPDHNWLVWAFLYLRRFLFLMYNFTPMLALAPLAYLDVFGVRSYWLNLVVNSFANGGSTFIKLGQWISMRSDIFPIEICDHLSELRMGAPSHSFEETCQVIREAFGKEVDEIFDRFYIEPCASGSIAQVHKGQICINAAESDNYFDDDQFHGERSLLNWAWNTFISPKENIENKTKFPKYLDVAVKVRHPDILQNMYIDINLMYFLSNVISSLPGLKGLKFPIHQQNFTQYLESQIDLSYEGKSLKKMQNNFERHGNDEKEVIFPKVLEGLSCPAVLVETWEYGVPLCNLDLNKLTDECRHDIAMQCYDVFMKMALRDNFVHGDCHSGNILIRAVDVTDGNATGRMVSVLKDRKERLSKMVSESAEESATAPSTDSSTDSSTESVAASISESESAVSAVHRDIEGPLIFLDAGLTASLTKEGHQRFGVMMGHIATAQCDKAAELFGTWAVMDPQADPLCYERRGRFVDQLGGIIEDSLQWRYKDVRGNPIPKKGIPYISIGPLLRNVLVLTQREHIVLDSSFSAVIASLGIIEGLIKTLDPSADFLQWGVPYLVKYRKLDSLRYLIGT